MIQECPDFKTLDPSDILERLNTHEFQLSEKRDIYGPNYGRTHALKAKAVSLSEEEFDSSSDDPEDIGKELAMLVKKFVQLDSTARNIICGHLTKGQYGRVSALETLENQCPSQPLQPLQAK